MNIVKIYIITNLENNMVYIGQTTKSLEERFNSHIKDAKIGEKNISLYKDMVEFGFDQFKIELITEALFQNRFIIENYYINHYYEKGYAVYNMLGLKAPNSRKQKLEWHRLNSSFDYQSTEFREKMSHVTSGEKNGMFGRKGAKAVNGQGVWALDKNGKIIHNFVSVKEALNFLGLKGHVGLIEACKTGKQYKGYYWKKEWSNKYVA